MDNQDDRTPGEALPEAPDDSIQQVETERMGEEPRMGEQPGFRGYRYQSPQGGVTFAFSSLNNGEAGSYPKAPVAATWICLLLAWLALGSKIPFTVLIGIPFNLAALFLATISLGRGKVFTGLSVLLLGTAGSLVVYLVGLFRFLVML